MKKIFLTLTVGIISISSIFAGINPDLQDEMNEKVIIDLSEIQLNPYSEDFVLVSFKIEKGEIKIQNISGSQALLKKLIVKKMVQMNIESEYDADFIYRYKFTFAKI
jgi:hypothetical protein